MNGKGLQKLKRDERDYSHDRLLGSLSVAQLPTKDFTIYDSFPYTITYGDTLSKICARYAVSLPSLLAMNPKIKDANKIYAGQVITIPSIPINILSQFDLDFCVGFSTVELQYALWGTHFDPLYQMQKIKRIRGEYNQFGANLRDGVSSAKIYGSLPTPYAPYTHNGSAGDKTRDFLANWANWPLGLDTNALKYKVAAYYTVDGPYDIFDNMRQILSMHKTQREGVTFGLEWHPEWNYVPGGVIPDVMPTSQGEGHDMAFIGQKTINGKMYLIAQQSWSESFGDKGLFYFPRTIIDQSYQIGYGAFILSKTGTVGASSGFSLDSVVGFIKKLLKL